MSPETLTLLGLAVIVVIAVAGGLALSFGQRRGRDEATLLGLGFARGEAEGHLIGRWQGRQLGVEVVPKALRVSTALSVAPLPHEMLARALGRGDLLARLYQLEASAGTDALIAHLPTGLRARGVCVLLDDVVTLAALLEAMPRQEAMARWYLDTAGGAGGGPEVDRAEALAKLIAAFPEAAETLAVCRSEVEVASDPRAAELARRHLERDSDASKTA